LGSTDQGTNWASWENVENIGGRSAGAFYKDISGLLPKPDITIVVLHQIQQDQMRRRLKHSSQHPPLNHRIR